MKKIILLALITFCVLPASAQKFTNKIGIGFDLGVPVGDFADNYKTGYGGYLKGLIGVSKNGYITITTGYTSYKLIPNIYYKSGRVGIIPILGAYRHIFSGFYIEPHFGVGIYNLHYTGIGGTVVKDSQGGFNYGAGIGYTISDFDIGVHFDAGSVDINNFSLIGFRLGYNFSFSK